LDYSVGFKATNVTTRAMYKRTGGFRDGKQMSLKMGLENSQRGCRGDVLWQTVPNTSSGDRKSSVTEGGQSSTVDNQ